MEAYLKNYRQSPRKVRLVANVVKGKKVPDALIALEYTVKRASDPLATLIKAAASNASHNFGVPVDMLVVRSLTVNKGIILKRMMPRARGSGARINKRTSHVHVVLGDSREAKATGHMKRNMPKAKAVKAVAKAEVKPVKAIKSKKVSKTTK